MASPSSPRDRYLSRYDWAGVRVRWEIADRVEWHDGTVLLDVGAGWGKYRELLPEFTMDAVEIWRPYINAERLRERYRIVFEGDIADVPLGWYDAIILGDVFEHLTHRKAELVLRRLTGITNLLLVVVPFNYEQGAVDGNPFEQHLQDDLTPEVMAERYGAWLQPLDFGDGKGLYIFTRETL